MDTLSDAQLFTFASIVIAIGAFLFLFPQGNRKGSVRMVGIGAMVIGALMMARATVFTVDEAEALVITQFKKIHKTVVNPGLNWKFPWMETFTFPKRPESKTEKIEVRSSDGLKVEIEVTSLMKVDLERLEDIYRNIAKSYEEMDIKRITPTLRDVIRNTASKFEANLIYKEREKLAIMLREDATIALGEAFILLDDLKLRNIVLPQKVEDQINEKLAAQQSAEAMEFEKLKAEKEAEIRIIDARSIAESQKIINSTLSRNYLQHEAIQAYKKLADSSNKTFVLMPTDGKSTGMPMIINSQ